MDRRQLLAAGLPGGLEALRIHNTELKHEARYAEGLGIDAEILAAHAPAGGSITLASPRMPLKTSAARAVSLGSL